MTVTLHRSRSLFVLLGFALTLPAAGAELGVLRYGNEKPVEFTSAVACVPRYDTIGFGKSEVVVLLSDRALEAGAIGAGVNCDAHAFEQAVERGRGVLLSIGFGKKLELDRVSVYGVGFTLGSDDCQGCTNSAAYAGDRLRGRVATTQPLELASSSITFEIQIDLPRPEAPAVGVAIPAGGGDPGKAFLAYVEAYRKGDYEALVRLLPEGKAEDKWGYLEEAEERRQSIVDDGDLEPKSAKVLSGTRLGDYALLIVEIPSLWSSDRQKALVGMSLVGGEWRVDDLSRDNSGTMFGR